MESEVEEIYENAYKLEMLPWPLDQVRAHYAFGRISFEEMESRIESRLKWEDEHGIGS